MRYWLTCRWPGPFRLALPEVPGGLQRSLRGRPEVSTLALTVQVHHTDAPAAAAWLAQHGGTDVVKHRTRRAARERVAALLGETTK